MKLYQTAFTKMKDYFTANRGRKIFFWGLVTAIVALILMIVLQVTALAMMVVIALVVAAAGSLWDSMQARYEFLKKIREMQYEHLKTIYDQQAEGAEVDMTPTFTDEEARYLRRRKWGFLFVILFKTGLVIALFSLLLAL